MTTTSASINIDGLTIRHYSFNRLRASYGMVPPVTIPFTGTILANLQAGNPNASFDQMVEACSHGGHP